MNRNVDIYFGTKGVTFIPFLARKVMVDCGFPILRSQVYEKGAEVVRMYKTLLGSEGFRKVRKDG